MSGPSVSALHAFIGDPLFGLDTTDGTLFGILPDERTAMASTTKIWAFDLTAHSLETGCVQVSDEVTITAQEASWGGSSMDDVNGNPIEAGEVITLETLIRGMMYPSGNNATYAIARHVAESCIAPGSTWQDYVAAMNQHAVALGLTDTAFTNPNGYDDPYQEGVTPEPEEYNHYTTARELSQMLEHAIEDDYLQEVVGFQGTYTDTTQAPSGTKTYSWSWGFNYPGWEGAKGGGTQNCNGPNNGCMAMSAKRIGRRVLLAFMQGQPWVEEPGMFDYGFASIFHPDERGSSEPLSAAERHDLECISSSRCVTAILPTAGGVELVSWEPQVDVSTAAILDTGILPKSALPPGEGDGQGPVGDVALSHLGSSTIVLASRKGSSVELSRWSLGSGGAVALVEDGVKAGPATTMDLQSVPGGVFLTAFTDPDGALVLRSWRLEGSSLEKLDTYRDESRIYTDVAMAGPLATDVFAGHRAVTASLTAGAFVHHVWGVDTATGGITLLGDLVQAGQRANVEIAPIAVNTVPDGELFPPSYYATASRAFGQLELRFYRISSSGDPVEEGSSGLTGIPADTVGVAALGTGGILSAGRRTDDTVELYAWEARRNTDDSIFLDRVSGHEAPDATSLDLTRIPTGHAEGDYATAVGDPVTGALRLRLYRSGDRPY